VGLLAVALLAAGAIGTVHETTRLSVFLACALLLALALVARGLSGQRLALTLPHVALAAAATMTLVQLIPLPQGVLRLLSPRAAEVFADAGLVGPQALTLDVPASLDELAKLTAYLAFYGAVTVYAGRAHRRLHVIGAIAAVATLEALLGMLQALIDPTRVLFFYAPNESWPALVRGTFVNPNHFGALMTLGAPCALTLAVVEPRLRWLGAFGAVVTSVGAVLCLGRISLATTLLAEGMALVLLLRSREKHHVPTWVWALAGLGMLAGGLLALDRVEGAWSATSFDEVNVRTSKVGIWREALPLLSEFPMAGVGRGAFAFAVNQVSELGGKVRLPFVENFFLQVLLDWGALAGSGLLLLLAWALKVGLRGIKTDPLMVACGAGVVGLVVHEVFDFAVELPGVALPALALLACMHARRGPDREPPVGTKLRFQWGLMAIPVAVIATAVLGATSPDAVEVGRRLAAASRDRAVSADALIGMGQDLARRHPADDYIPLVVASRLAAEGHADAIRWINRAATLSPANHRPHLLAARFLADRGRRTQALLEYRTAAALAPDGRDVWAEVATRFAGLEALLAATPEPLPFHRMLGKWLRGSGRSREAMTVCERILERDPRHAWAIRSLAEMWLEAGDPAQAMAYLPRLLAIDHGDPARLLEIRTLIRAGRLLEAGRRLDGRGGRSLEDADLEFSLAEALVEAGDLVGARARLEALGAWQISTEGEARLHAVRAELEQRAGNRHQADLELERSRRLRSR
jgi:Flp pilus assembly protein TadD